MLYYIGAEAECCGFPKTTTNGVVKGAEREDETTQTLELLFAVIPEHTQNLVSIMKAP